MANISFFQVMIVLILLFLMFGDTQKFKQNFSQIKEFFFTKEKNAGHLSRKNQEKRDSNP
jgi:hypothetical protein